MEILSFLPGVLVVCSFMSLFFPKVMAFWSKADSPSRFKTFFIYIFIFFIISLSINKYNINNNVEEPIKKENHKNLNDSQYIHEIQTLKIKNLTKYGKYNIQIFHNSETRMLINLTFENEISYNNAIIAAEEYTRHIVKFISEKENINKYINVYPSCRSKGETGKDILIKYKGYAKYSPYSDSISWIKED